MARRYSYCGRCVPREPDDNPAVLVLPAWFTPLCYSWWFSAKAATVMKLRLSINEYLNAAPLAWGLTDGPLAGRYELSFAVPSLCAEALRRGDADFAIIPAIEYQRIENLAVLPGMAVAAKAEVRSILVVAKKPIQRAQRIALDANSRSSAALVRLLCRSYWKIQPDFVEMEPDASAMLASADAALVIGDSALRIAVKMDVLATRQTNGEQCCEGDPKAMPVPGFDTLYVYDIGFQWREMTGLPSVLAVWSGRVDAVTPQVVADFQASLAYGRERLTDIAEGASFKLELPAPALEKYLRENLDYSLDAANLAGLQHYYRECASAGIIPRARPIQWAEAATPAPAAQD
jgi:chorismate dehydratase